MRLLVPVTSNQRDLTNTAWQMVGTKRKRERNEFLSLTGGRHEAPRRWTLYRLSHMGSPKFNEMGIIFFFSSGVIDWKELETVRAFSPTIIICLSMENLFNLD